MARHRRDTPVDTGGVAVASDWAIPVQWSERGVLRRGALSACPVARHRRDTPVDTGGVAVASD